MDYKQTIFKDNYVIIVDQFFFNNTAQGDTFRGILTKKFPEAKGKFTIGFATDDGDYFIESPGRTVVNAKALKEIPENQWNQYSWPEEEKAEEEDVTPQKNAPPEEDSTPKEE